MVGTSKQILMTIIFMTNIFICGYPGAPSHATVTFSSEDITTGTVATHSCERGFELLGPARRICSENGTWIPHGIPFCVKSRSSVFDKVTTNWFGLGIPNSTTSYTEYMKLANIDLYSVYDGHSSRILYVSHKRGVIWWITRLINCAIRSSCVINNICIGINYLSYM
ncbi:hypothetical protein GQR58_017694 [Nymphon striatum]|nr:hypothetical protein GQR58_017694 [Nymphon striatum]